jgi:hypothetical protein
VKKKLLKFSSSSFFPPLPPTFNAKSWRPSKVEGRREKKSKSFFFPWPITFDAES